MNPEQTPRQRLSSHRPGPGCRATRSRASFPARGAALAVVVLLAAAFVLASGAFRLSLVRDGVPLTSNTVLAASKDPYQQLQEITQQIRALKERVMGKKREESRIAQTLQGTQQAYQRTQARLDQLESQLFAVKTQIRQTEQAIAEARAREERLQQQLIQRQDVMGTRLRSIYQLSGVSYFQLLFNARSLDDLMVRAEYLGYILRYDLSLLRQLAQAQQQVAQARQDLEARQAALDSQRQRLAQLQDQTNQAIADLNRQIASQRSALASVRSERAAIEEDLAALQRSSEQIQRMLQQRKSRVVPGGLQPFIWPVQGPITSPYGYRVHPILGRAILHTGIDIAVPYGTPVRAVAAGDVVMAGWVNGYGKTVVIDHGNGISTLYGHNSILLVQAGEQVQQGEVIARAGATGLATGPHVHFEVRRNGAPENPLPWLP
ncbi:MAG: peptidoglycan DD-metalloendopeptidase family protein [Firmicutes bacterium]|nr:peptidoglycan DD-metalloendopeptidase family protein [Bacillota bacterium]